MDKIDRFILICITLVFIILMVMIVFYQLEDKPLKNYQIVTANHETVTVQYETCRTRSKPMFTDSTFLDVVCYTNDELKYEVIAISINEIQ